MAEYYLCNGESVSFSNGGAKMLQELWIQELKKIETNPGVQDMILVLEEENSSGPGTRAYGIDNIGRDFKAKASLENFLFANAQILQNFDNELWVKEIFEIKLDNETRQLWKARLGKISSAIENEIRSFEKK